MARQITVTQHHPAGEWCGSALYTWSGTRRVIAEGEIRGVASRSFMTRSGSSVLGPADGAVITLTDGSEVVVGQQARTIRRELNW